MTGAPLSPAWQKACHPRHATKGVIALRGEPLRASHRAGAHRARQQPRPQQQRTLPSAPGGVAATAGANQAAVSWTAANGNGNTITAYVLREATGHKPERRSPLVAAPPRPR